MNERAKSRVLRVGIINSVPLEDLDPTRAPFRDSVFVARQIFDAPFSPVLGSGEVVPNLVEVESAADGELLMRLVPGLRFSDGTPLELSHVVETLERFVATLRIPIELSVEGETLRAISRTADQRLDLLFGTSECGVFLRTEEGVIGSGPFRLHEQSTPDSIRLTRNPHDPRPCALSEVRVRSFPLDENGKATALVEAVRAGEVDLTFDVPRQEVATLQGVRKWIAPALSTALLFLNLRRPGLADVRTRRAIAHAIDRYEVTRISFENPLAFMASSILPRPMAEVDDGIDHDLALAKELLPDGAAGSPLRLMPIWCPRPYLLDPLQAAERIVKDLAKIGLEAEVHPSSDSEDFYRRIVAGTEDLILSGWIADNPDPAIFLEGLLSSDSVTTLDHLASNANHGAYRSDAMDRALAAYRQTRGDAELRSVLEQMASDAPMVPLSYGAQTTVASFAVNGLSQSPVVQASVRHLEIGD